MSINERIAKFSEYYIAKNSLNQKEFSRIIGISPSQLNSIISGRDKVGLSVIEKFLNFYPTIDANWLIKGNGSMFVKKDNLEVNDFLEVYKSIKSPEKNIERQLIPIYNIEAAAGLVSLFNDFSKFTPVDYISLPNLGKVDGGLYACGDSMYPLIKSGDIVVFREIQDKVNNIFWGEMYLLSYDLEGEEYIVIKYIQKSDQEGYVRLVSQNINHQPKDIPIERIRALAQVKASVRFNVIRNTF